MTARTVSTLLTLFVLSSLTCACGDGDSEDTASSGDGDGDGDDTESSGDGDGDGDDNTEACDAPSDVLTDDDFAAGESSVICYYAPPEGYCRELTGGFEIESAEAGDKANMGCADAVVVTGGACPMDTAVGRCVGWGTEESRVYYECNKFDSIFPDGLEKGCTDKGGTWEAF